MEKNKIGDYIKQKRKEKGLSQQGLGKILYVTDKAVSKWERNIGLPDVAILEELAKALDTTVNNILNGSDDSETSFDIKRELENAKQEIDNNNQKNRNKIITLSSLFLIIITLIVYANISFGYTIKAVNFGHFYTPKQINIGIPKTSFMMKYNDKSLSFKNLRNKNILENEIKNYLKSLKYLSCNNTIYYYNEKDNFSITSYSVDNHVLYKTINYTIVDDDYCTRGLMKEYSDKLGGLRRVHVLNQVYESEADLSDKLAIMFINNLDNYDNKNRFKASLTIEHGYKENNKIKTELLEESQGHYEIKADKLYYYRNKITKNSEKINIPEVSIFKIEDTKLILIDNYLSKYSDNIILK